MLSPKLPTKLLSAKLVAPRTDHGRLRAGHSVRLESNARRADSYLVYFDHVYAGFLVSRGYQVLCVSNFDDRDVVCTFVTGRSTGSAVILVLIVGRCFALGNRLLFHCKLIMDMGNRWTRWEKEMLRQS